MNRHILPFFCIKRIWTIFFNFLKRIALKLRIFFASSYEGKPLRWYIKIPIQMRMIFFYIRNATKLNICVRACVCVCLWYEIYSQFYKYEIHFLNFTQQYKLNRLLFGIFWVQNFHWIKSVIMPTCSCHSQVQKRSHQNKVRTFLQNICAFLLALTCYVTQGTQTNMIWIKRNVFFDKILNSLRFLWSYLMTQTSSYKLIDRTTWGSTKNGKNNHFDVFILYFNFTLLLVVQNSVQNPLQTGIFLRTEA